MIWAEVQKEDFLKKLEKSREKIEGKMMIKGRGFWKRSRKVKKVKQIIRKVKTKRRVECEENVNKERIFKGNKFS